MDARIEVSPSSTDTVTVALDGVHIKQTKVFNPSSCYLEIFTVTHDVYSKNAVLLLRGENSIETLDDAGSKGVGELCVIGNGSDQCSLQIGDQNPKNNGSLSLVGSSEDSDSTPSGTLIILDAQVDFFSGTISCVNAWSKTPQNARWISGMTMMPTNDTLSTQLVLNGGNLIVSTPNAPVNHGWGLFLLDQTSNPLIPLLKVEKGSLLARDCNYGAVAFAMETTVVGKQTGGTISLRGTQAGLALLDSSGIGGGVASFVQEDGYLEASSVPAKFSFAGQELDCAQPTHQGGLYYKGEGLDKNMPEATIPGEVTLNTNVDLPASLRIPQGAKLIIEKDVAIDPDYEAYGNNPIEIVVEDGGEIENDGGTIDPDLLAKRLLTFDANGGTFESGTAQTVEVVFTDSTITLPAQEPTRTGFTFIGYFTEATGGTEVTQDTALPTTDTTYYAHWQAGPGPQPTPDTGGADTTSADTTLLPITGDVNAPASQLAFIAAVFLGLLGVATGLGIGMRKENEAS